MIDPGDAVLVAVSGGPDSMALLHLLVALSPALSLRLGVAHLDHGLRKEAAQRDAAFVAGAAAGLGLPCHVGKENVTAYRDRHRLNLEEAARTIRYRFLGQTAAAYGYSRLATGHQADDNAELVLMNLLRGSGPGGLAGIPPRRRLSEADGPPGRPGARIDIIRPLIAVTREEVLAYLSDRSIAHVTDDSNSDPAYLRNRLRRDLIPHLARAYNPRIAAALNRLSAILRSEDEWADAVARGLFETLARPPSPDGGGILPWRRSSPMSS